jgi:hypothetical protein
MNPALSILLTAVLAVPAQEAKEEPSVPAPTGFAPQIVYVKPDADGVIRITVSRPIGKQSGPGAGAAGSKVLQRVPLKDVKDLVITLPSGYKIETSEAEKRLSRGACVLISAGKEIEPAYLRMYRNDVLILTSPELPTPAALRKKTTSGKRGEPPSEK